MSRKPTARNHTRPGSASEVECQILLAHDLKYLNELNHGELLSQTVEVKRMLASFIKTLRKPQA